MKLTPPHPHVPQLLKLTALQALQNGFHAGLEGPVQAGCGAEPVHQGP